MQINKPAHVWQLSFEGEWPTSVTFLGDQYHLAAANRAGHIYVWNLPTELPKQEEKKGEKSKGDEPADWAPSLKLEGHTNGVTRLLAADKGKTLISASLDRTIRLWNWNETPEGKATVVLDASARERQARGKGKEEKEKILNAPGVEVPTLAKCEVLAGHTEWIQAMGLNGEGTRLISGDDACVSRVWDVVEKKVVSSWNGYPRAWVSAAALPPDRSMAFTAEFAGSRSDFDRPAAQARLWKVADGSLQLDLLKTWTPDVKDKDRIDSYGYAQTWGKLLKRGLVCAAFSPDGQLLAVGQGGETDKGQAHVVEVSSGKILRTISGHQYGMCDLAFSADGQYLLTCGRDTTVRICQISDGKEVAVLGTPRGGQFKDWLYALSVSPDQQWVAAADIAGFVQVWKLSN